MSERRVAAGLSSAADTVGLTGLVPFEVIVLPEVKLARRPGIVRVLIELPPGRTLDVRRGMSYRVHGGEAGLEFVRSGQIVLVQGVTPPLLVPYSLREYPAPPERSELALDCTFWHTDGGPSRGQDVQWRVPVQFAAGAAGSDRIDLPFTLRE